MDTNTATLLAGGLGAAGAIIAALIGVWGVWYGRKLGLEEGHNNKIQFIRYMLDSAPEKYIQHLETAIKNGINEGEEKAVINARAIVDIRNDLRKTLMNISNLLNTEISYLATQIGKIDEIDKLHGYKNNKSNKIDEKEIYETIQVLDRKWPSKQDQVKVEIQKVLAELGLK